MASEADLPRSSAIAVDLTGEDLLLLRAGLRAYLKHFAAHREEDAEVSHPPEEWAELQRRVGELIWMLELAGAPPEGQVIHSDEAVDPGE